MILAMPALCLPCTHLMFDTRRAVPHSHIPLSEFAEASHENQQAGRLIWSKECPFEQSRVSMEI